MLRLPAVSLHASAAHQHRPLAVGEALRLEERLDGLLEIDHGKSAGPVGAPQAALEAPGVESWRYDQVKPHWERLILRAWANGELY